MLRSMYDLNMFNTRATALSALGLGLSGANSSFVTFDTSGQGRLAGNTFRLQGVFTGVGEYSLTFPCPQHSSVFMGLRMKLSGWAPSAAVPFIFSDGTTSTTQVAFRIAADGIITWYRGSGTTNLLGVSTVPVPLEQLVHLGIEVTFSNSGSIRMVLNGITEILNLTGVDTTQSANAFATSFIFGNSGQISGNTYCYIGEIFFGDGASPGMTSLPGDVGISHLRPTADGTYTAWTPSTGSAWDCVDETVLDAADYISTTGAANKASFQVSDLTAAMGGVKALAPFAIAAKPEAGDTNVACGVITNSTEVQGTTHAPGPTSTLVQTIYEKNPVTANDWTSGEVNALQVLYTSV